MVHGGLARILDSFSHRGQRIRVLWLLTGVSDHVLGSFQRNHKLASRTLEGQREVVVAVRAILVLLLEFSHVLAEDLLALLAGKNDLKSLLQSVIFAINVALPKTQR